MSPPVVKTTFDPSHLETQAFDVMEVDFASKEDRRQAAKVGRG